MRHFFTADPHFGHMKIMEYCHRDFIDVSEMNREIVDRINEVVGENDILWMLGDFCFSRDGDAPKIWKKYRDRIRCRYIGMVRGNHDYLLHDRNPLAENLFFEVCDYKKLNIDEQCIILSHYAMAAWEKSGHGSWQLYGHSHSNAEKWMDEHMPGRRSIDVGIDNAKLILGEYRPFSFEELKAIFRDRTGAAIDHHKGAHDVAMGLDTRSFQS